MARFNTATKTGVRSPITTTTPATTALGGQGFERDPKSELFLLAVSNMASKNGVFHEDGDTRDARYTALIQACAADTDWFYGFLGFLRDTANMRSASIIAAADAVKARLDAKITGNRALISRVLQRADEPGELLAYWTATYGRNVPQPVKRGIADAIDRLYTERSFLKWDSENRGYRFADVLQLVHPKTDAAWRNALYKHILNDRYQTGAVIDAESPLSTIRARQQIMAVPVPERRAVTAGQLAEAGMTWESIAGWLQGPMDAAAWETAIPSMGYMALLRNLRNFDQTGISKIARREVEDRLTDPDQVAKSRQLPMRFLSAYRATRDSGTVTAWGPVIEEALNLSLANVPTLGGRTLVLVDLSGSMYQSQLSDKSGLRFVDVACIFGAAIALRCGAADLIGFGTTTQAYAHTAASSLLPLANTMETTDCVLPGYGKCQGLGGTDTVGALQSTFSPGHHDRIIIITDEQYANMTSYFRQQPTGTVDQIIDQCDVPTYTWNLAGYRVAQGRSGPKRWTFGGLSDNGLKMVPLIESGIHQSWPWN